MTRSPPRLPRPSARHRSFRRPAPPGITGPWAGRRTSDSWRARYSSSSRCRRNAVVNTGVSMKRMQVDYVIGAGDARASGCATTSDFRLLEELSNRLQSSVAADRDVSYERGDLGVRPKNCTPGVRFLRERLAPDVTGFGIELRRGPRESWRRDLQDADGRRLAGFIN